MNRVNIILVATLALSSLSSCGIYTKYSSEVDSERVDSLYSYIEASSDTTNIATLSWRELFTDPKLQELIEQGLSSNTDLNVARLNIEQAEAALESSRLAFLPTLNLSASDNVSRGSKPSYSLAASSSWEIDIFGALRNAKEQSKAALEQSRAYSDAVQTSLISSIAGCYYSLLMLDSQLDISNRTLDMWADNIRTMEALKRAGRLNNTSVLQSEASRVALEGSVVTLKKQIALMESTLSLLINQTTQSIDRGNLGDVAFASDLSVGVPMQLLSNRPDVRAAEYNLVEAFYATNEARSALYPNITLSGSMGFMDSSGELLDPSEFIMSAVGSVVQPIFNRGALRAEVKISKAQQEQALLQFNRSLLEAGAEVNDAIIELQSSRESLTYDAKRVTLLEESLRSSLLLMKHGSATYLEVLTAQYTLLQAELSTTSYKNDEIQGVIELYRALGGGVR